MTVSLVLGFVNVCAGVMEVLAILLFMGGFIRYSVLLGTDRRKEGLVTMFWGITVLFVLVVILGVVNILRGPLFFLIGAALVLFAAFVIVLSLGRSKSE